MQKSAVTPEIGGIMEAAMLDHLFLVWKRRIDELYLPCLFDLELFHELIDIKCFFKNRAFVKSDILATIQQLIKEEQA